MSKDPKLNPALNTKCNVYYVALSSFTEDAAPKPVSYTIEHFYGASTSPVFSPDGKSAAFLSMLTAGYEADKSQIFLIPNLTKSKVVQLLQSGDGKQSWDRSPQVSKLTSGTWSCMRIMSNTDFARTYNSVMMASTSYSPPKTTDTAACLGYHQTLRVMHFPKS